MWGTGLMSAQTTALQTPQNAVNAGGFNTNQLGISGLTFSNRTGQVFSPDDLAMQLQNLRSAVDQSLPILSAFNEHYSNSVAGRRQTVAGTLSGIVSDVLHRNQTTNPNTTGNQSSFGASNLLSILHGLMNTNSTGAAGSPPSNTQDLIVLQDELQLVASSLQRLNVSVISNQFTTPYNNGNLTPTGR
jgi:hypothetical protein